MWIYSKIGFFSIVQGKNPGEFLVRGRARQDLENLRAFLAEPEKSPILTFAGTDYQYRIVVSSEDLAHLMQTFVGLVDYKNFKAQIRDKSRHDIYSRVWSICYQLKDH
jgi:hypothetical protein